MASLVYVFRAWTWGKARDNSKKERKKERKKIFELSNVETQNPTSEPSHEKTNDLYMRKERRRSAVQ